jgi:hypothetical protein
MGKVQTPTTANGGSPHSILFVSTCPKCKRELPQRYNRAVLRRLISRALPVEGYCVMCDGYWSLTVLERASLMAALATN